MNRPSGADDRVVTVSHEVIVRSYELDSYAHVNNGAYLGWFEDGRERFLRAAGRDYNYFPSRLGLYFVVAAIHCEFRRAAHSGDTLTVRSRIAATGRSSVVFRQIVVDRRDDFVLCRARTVMAFTPIGGGKGEIPAEFAAAYGVSSEGDVWTAAEGGERG